MATKEEILDAIAGMTVLELSELLSDFEEKFLPENWKNAPEEALEAGRFGGEYLLLRDFVDSIIHDTVPPIDVFTTMDFTVPGLASEASIGTGGAPAEVPDLREME